MNIVKHNLRMIAIYDKEGNAHFVFSVDKDDSHRTLYKKTYEEQNIDRNFNIPIYGRFYSLLYGNSRYPQLIIYGSSSDYPIDSLEYHQDPYELAIRSMAFANNWDVLFLP